MTSQMLKCLNTYQKGTVIFQTGIWHPEKQGKRDCCLTLPQTS